MSLIVTTYVPEGIVTTSDSRQSITIGGKRPDGKPFRVETVNSDAVTKTFLFDQNQVGISNFGQDFLGEVPMASHIKKFKEKVIEKTDDVKSIAQKTVSFFRKDFPGADAGFHVYGYRKKNKVSIPYAYYCHIGKNVIERRNEKNGKILFGATWSGQHDVISKILKSKTVIGKGGKSQPTPIYPIAFQAMSLQDAVDFSVYAIKTTIDTMRFQARSKSVGGPIDILVITPDGAQWLKRKGLDV